MARKRNRLADMLEDARERAALEALLPRLAAIDPLLPQLAVEVFRGDDTAFMAWTDRMEEMGRGELAARFRAMIARGTPARLREVAARLTGEG